MTVFVQHNNGTIRRVRGTFGGSQAWKQHVDCDCGWGHRRRHLIEQEESRLAAEQMRDALAHGSLSSMARAQHQGQRSPSCSRHQVEAPAFQTVTMTTVPVKKASPIRRPFKVVKSETGKLVCVFLD